MENKLVDKKNIQFLLLVFFKHVFSKAFYNKALDPNSDVHRSEETQKLIHFGLARNFTMSRVLHI